MTYRALLIGNSVFDQDGSLNRLNAPIKDVTRLYGALVDPSVGMFDDANVQVLTEQSTSRIVEELDEFFEQGRREDLLLLYYSGHGLLNERNRLFLCGRDTRSDRLLRTAVGNTQINDFIEQSMAGTTVVVLDCCSAGMFKAGGPVGDQLAGSGRYIVSSVRGDELANDSAERTGTSLFTEHLVQGLMGGAGDVNSDGYVDLREIYDYVRGRLLDTSRQRPHCRFDGDGSVHLARAAPMKPVPSQSSEQPGRYGPPAPEEAQRTPEWPSRHTHAQHGWSAPPPNQAATAASTGSARGTMPPPPGAMPAGPGRPQRPWWRRNLAAIGAAVLVLCLAGGIIAAVTGGEGTDPPGPGPDTTITNPNPDDSSGFFASAHNICAQASPVLINDFNTNSPNLSQDTQNLVNALTQLGSPPSNGDTWDLALQDWQQAVEMLNTLGPQDWQINIMAGANEFQGMGVQACGAILG
jgi:hypothetical protein